MCSLPSVSSCLWLVESSDWLIGLPLILQSQTVIIRCLIGVEYTHLPFDSDNDYDACGDDDDASVVVATWRWHEYRFPQQLSATSGEDSAESNSRHVTLALPSVTVGRKLVYSVAIYFSTNYLSDCLYVHGSYTFVAVLVLMGVYLFICFNTCWLNWILLPIVHPSISLCVCFRRFHCRLGSLSISLACIACFTLKCMCVLFCLYVYVCVFVCFSALVMFLCMYLSVLFYVNLCICVWLS